MPPFPRLLVFGLLLTLSPGALAATYTVDGERGDDGNDGITAPFRTLGKAVAALRTSDTLVIVKTAAPYRESLPLTVGGTAAAPLVIEGNGATLSGADPAPQDGWERRGEVFAVAQSQEVKFLFGPGVCYRQGPSAAGLSAEEWYWHEGRLCFRPAADKTPGDYDLLMSVRVSGVLTTGAGQIVVRNLTCEHFYNDGFNIHGGSAPLWFEQIRGLWNGDEGFSCHENCECYVRDAEFAHNQWHGIADVNFARSHYSGLSVHDNISKGIWFLGGMHSVIDSEVFGSPTNIALSRGDYGNVPLADQHPLRRSVTNLRNVIVRSTGEQVGIAIGGGAAGVLEHCLVQGGKTALDVEADATAYVVNSIISGAQAAEITARGSYLADYNLYHPGRLSIAGTLYPPERFEDYRAATGNDAHSFLHEPRFIDGTLWTSRASPGKGATFNSAYGGPDIGPRPRGPAPEEDPSILPPGATTTAEGGIVYGYDFEASNPWSRVYPEPEENDAGEAVLGGAELSGEQAQSGKGSCRLQVTLPAGPPQRWNIKWFTIKLAYDMPVRRLSLWLYGDGSGRQYRLRVRDGSGECFWGKRQSIDWTGWRRVSWDLRADPPQDIGAGDGNRRQDVPPLEVVLEAGATAGETVVLYADDLEVEIGR